MVANPITIPGRPFSITNLVPAGKHWRFSVVIHTALAGTVTIDGWYFINGSIRSPALRQGNKFWPIVKLHKHCRAAIRRAVMEGVA